MTDTEQELKNIIQQAWCDGDSNPKDRFGDFLTRAAKRILKALPSLAKEAGYKSPEEAKELNIWSVDETREINREIWAKEAGYKSPEEIEQIVKDARKGYAQIMPHKKRPDLIISDEAD